MIRLRHGLRCYALLCLLVQVMSSESLDCPDGEDSGSYFTNEFAAQIEGGIEVARDVALQHGFKLKMQIGSLADYYLLEHEETPVRSKRTTDRRHTDRLVDEPRVVWFQQQEAQERVKRDVAQRDMQSVVFDDPLYSEQWYLTGQSARSRDLQTDMHVKEVWEQDITGKGVVVCIVDDGLESNHSDIRDNYDPSASWNYKENCNDPTPPRDRYESNGHGTRCAGEVAMEANNNKCGVGIAFQASIGGVRMLDGKVTDALEGSSLSHNLGHVDIYSASWGPTDDGQTTQKPGPLVLKALEDGIRLGRNGKGAIYAWASGNGGHKDNCNCDAYSGSIYTIATGSASEHGQKTYYGEACSSIMTTSYSSGQGSHSVISVDMDNSCTKSHGGTSASAPMTAGVLALLLQANPELTWRDVQHIVVESSNTKPLRKAVGVEWKRNSAGHLFSDHFGFGLLDAEAMVALAKPETWRRVPEKSICKVAAGPSFQARKVAHDHPLQMTIMTDGCKSTSDKVTYLEHVVLTVTIQYTRRGALNILLTSPSGTTTKLLTERDEDMSMDGMTDFPLMSVQLWGERADSGDGVWELDIFDSQPNLEHTGYLLDWKLDLHGTTELPEYVRRRHDESA